MAFNLELGLIMDSGTKLYSVRGDGESKPAELEVVTFVEQSLAAPECTRETWLCRDSSGACFRCSVGAYHRTVRGAWLEYLEGVESSLRAMNREREDLNRRMRFARKEISRVEKEMDGIGG